MSRRIEQLNEQLRGELANLIAKELPLKNSLITVSYVDCSTDLKYAKIGLSVLPDKLGPSVLKKIRKLSGRFSRQLRSKLTIRQIPRFNWTLDRTEKQAAEIEEIINKLKVIKFDEK